MKRLISMALAVAFMFITVTACSTSGKTNATGSSTTGNTQQTAAVTSTSPDTIHKLKVLGPVDESAEIKFSDRESYPVWQKFKEMLESKGLDITYETVPSDQYNVVIQTRLASAKDLPDFVNVSTLGNTAALSLAKQGLFLPVNKILEKGSGAAKKFLDEQTPFVAKLNTAPDGNMYWVTNIEKITYQDKPCSTCVVILIRKDWLDKLGLSAPTTAAEFVNVMKQFREKDANGNGVADEVLALNPSGFANGLAQWFGLGTDITSVSLEDQKIVSPWYQPGVKEYFKYMQALVKDGILDTSLFGDSTGERTNQKLVENKIGAQFSYAMEAWLEPAIKAEGAQLQPIGPLAAVDGITPVNAIETPFLAWGNWAVTSNCKDEEGMAALLDILYSDEYELLTCWGIEGKTYQVKNGIKEYLPGIGNAYYKEMAQNRNCMGQYIYGDSIFPRLRFAPMETEINSSPSHKAEFQKKVAFYTPTVPFDNSVYLAMPSDAELEEISSITTDLSTYSQELATQLVLGDKSLSDWDKYMEDMKKLKLDRLIEINQKRCDIYYNK